MTKTTIKIRAKPTKADVLGVSPCGCGEHCGLIKVSLYDARDNVISTADLDRTQAVEIASALMDLVELADQASRRTQGETIQ
jgi:hypothetical protein